VDIFAFFLAAATSLRIEAITMLVGIEAIERRGGLRKGRGPVLVSRGDAFVERNVSKI
jgi:hypothetical protein